MNRPLFTLLLALALLAGCSRAELRSVDPYDWKIHADDGDELDAWFNENVPLLPEELQREFTTCLGNIQSSVYAGPNSRGSDKRGNSLAAKLDGRSVRDVLIEGNEAGARLLEARLERETDALLRLVNTSAGDETGLPKAMTHQRARVDALKQQLARVQDHLTELHAGAIKR